MRFREYRTQVRRQVVVARRAVVVAALAVVIPRSVAADDARRLAALAIAANDARASIAIGPGGELYEPDGHGAWLRKRGGGIGPAVTTSARAGAQTIAGTTAGVFRLGPEGWSVIYLGQRAKPIVASGLRAVAAVGRQLFVLDQPPAAPTGHAPVPIATAPTPITAIGASATGIVVATDGGVLRLDGKTLVPVPRAPATVTGFAGDRWALVADGAVDLRTGAAINWPAGLVVMASFEAVDGSLVAAATTSAGVELVIAHGATLDRDKLDVTGAPIGVAVDRDGRAVVALADGRVCVRDHGAWTVVAIKDDLPPPRPGAPPATSH